MRLLDKIKRVRNCFLNWLYRDYKQAIKQRAITEGLEHLKAHERRLEEEREKLYKLLRRATDIRVGWESLGKDSRGQLLGAHLTWSAEFLSHLVCPGDQHEFIRYAARELGAMLESELCTLNWSHIGQIECMSRREADSLRCRANRAIYQDSVREPQEKGQA